jgi:hypothetical protein
VFFCRDDIAKDEAFMKSDISGSCNDSRYYTMWFFCNTAPAAATITTIGAFAAKITRAFKWSATEFAPSPTC